MANNELYNTVNRRKKQNPIGNIIFLLINGSKLFATGLIRNEQHSINVRLRIYHYLARKPDFFLSTILTRRRSNYTLKRAFKSAQPSVLVTTSSKYGGYTCVKKMHGHSFKSTEENHTAHSK